MTTTAAGPSIDLLQDINAAFNARDVDRILSFFADDATFLMARGPEPNGRRVHGKAAIGKVLADRFKVISGMRWDHIEHFVTGNRAVSVWMVTGTSADGEALVPRRQDPQQGHLLEDRRAEGPALVRSRVQRIHGVGADRLDGDPGALDGGHLHFDDQLGSGEAGDATAERGRAALRVRRRALAARAILLGALHGEDPPSHDVVRRRAGLAERPGDRALG
jgi:ketosteroid isomerase-like protein